MEGQQNQQADLQLGNYFQQSQQEEQKQDEVFENTANFGDILTNNDFQEEDPNKNNKNENQIIEDQANLQSQEQMTNCNAYFNQVNYEEDEDIPATFGEHLNFYDFQQQQDQNVINQSENYIPLFFRDNQNSDSDYLQISEDITAWKQEDNDSSSILNYLNSDEMQAQLGSFNFLRNYDNEVDLIQKESLYYYKSDPLKKAFQPNKKRIARKSLFEKVKLKTPQYVAAILQKLNTKFMKIRKIWNLKAYRYIKNYFKQKK